MRLIYPFTLHIVSWSIIALLAEGTLPLLTIAGMPIYCFLAMAYFTGWREVWIVLTHKPGDAWSDGEDKVATKQLLELKEEDIRLPRQLDLYNQYVQMNHEIKLLRQIPEMKKQLKEMEKAAGYIEDRLRVIGAGYDPIIPNRSTLHLGFLQKPSVRSGDELRSYNLYKHALPLPVLEKYMAAKKTGFFKFFSVHSPDPKVFSEVRLYPIDPLLVGWLHDSFYSSWNSYIDGNSEGFLIAQWDMQQDLSAAGLILPQTTQTGRAHLG